MIRRQGFQFRVEPTAEQRLGMERTAGVVRFIWNSALALQKYRLDKHLRILNYAELCRELSAARNDLELSFLAEIHSKPQQQVLKDLGKAFRACLETPMPPTPPGPAYRPCCGSWQRG